MKHYDDAIKIIADYIIQEPQASIEAYHTARNSLADALGCAILALKFPECTKLLGPVVPGTIVPKGSHVPGTSFVLDPIRAAFNIGTMIRWLDYNDTWLAAEWGHPSDNLGGLLAVTDYLSRNGKTITVHDLLTAMIQAYEIQGVFALENSFNRIGFDHVILVKLATTAVTAKLLGGTHQQIMDAVSHAWIDTGPLRTYRHAPNTGSRKSWAAGDATSRGVALAWMTIQGEMGYSSALSAKNWGFYDVLFKGKPFSIPRKLDCYVMENVLFKISYPAEFHAQTALECAIDLFPKVKNRWDDIETIEIDTHESAIRIIDKKGPLNNPADRDHCLQYIVAVGLLFGTLTAEHYEDNIAKDKRIDVLRSKMMVKENRKFSGDYLDPSKRSIANSVVIRFKDGTVLEKTVEYPIGHRLRREEAVPLLYQKLKANLLTHYVEGKADAICSTFQDHKALSSMSVSEMVNLWT